MGERQLSCKVSFTHQELTQDHVVFGKVTQGPSSICTVIEVHWKH